MGRHSHQHKKGSIVGTESIHTLTTEQCRDIAKAVVSHRPERLLDYTVGSGRIIITAVREGGRHEALGEWHLDILGNTPTLLVTIGDTLYAEMLPGGLSIHWRQIVQGLSDWAKAVNGIELADLLLHHPELSHLSAAHVMAEADYHPFGGGRAW